MTSPPATMTWAVSSPAAPPHVPSKLGGGEAWAKAGAVTASAARAATKARRKGSGTMRRGVSGRDHPLHFGDDLAQVNRLGQDLGAGGRAPGRKCDRGKAGDEHDAHLRLPGRRDA